MKKQLYLLAFLCLSGMAGLAQTAMDSLDVTGTVNAFVDAFSNLKWDEFSACFDERATAFFPPSARFPSRANGKEEILGIFKNVFENARKQKDSPPYISIHPMGARVQLAGSVAVVTFMLEDPTLFGRRTLVLQKEGGKWLIIHLHASGVALIK